MGPLKGLKDPEIGLLMVQLNSLTGNFIGVLLKGWYLIFGHVKES